MTARSATFALIAFAAAWVAVALLTYRGYGLTWDEEHQLLVAREAHRYYASFGRDTAIFDNFYGSPDIKTRGVLYVGALYGLVSLTTPPWWDLLHLLNGLFALLGPLLVWGLVTELTRNRAAGLAAALLLAFYPPYYGHAFNNTKDIPAAVFVAATLLFGARLLNATRERALDAFAFALALALAVGQRMPLAYLPALWLPCYVWKRRTRRAQRLSLAVLAAAALAGLTLLHLSQPYLASRPLVGLVDMARTALGFPWKDRVLFEGRDVWSWELRWYYLPKWIAITTPVLSLAFFALGNFAVARKLVHRNEGDAEQRPALLYVLGGFWAPLALVLLTRPVLYDAWRQFLFLAPALVVIAALGLQQLFAAARAWRVAAWTLLSLNLAVTGIALVRLHPYEYVYFNRLVGGLAGAYQRYETDYWGASYREALDWVRAHKDAYRDSDGKVYLDTCLPDTSVQFLDEDMCLDRDRARLYVCSTRWHLEERRPGPIVHVVEREGVPLNLVKEVEP